MSGVGLLNHAQYIRVNPGCVKGVVACKSVSKDLINSKSIDLVKGHLNVANFGSADGIGRVRTGSNVGEFTEEIDVIARGGMETTRSDQTSKVGVTVHNLCEVTVSCCKEDVGVDRSNFLSH